MRKKVAEVTTEAYSRYIKGDTTAIPHWMQIREGDSDKQREKKAKAIKAFKKKMRYVAPPLIRPSSNGTDISRSAAICGLIVEGCGGT